MAGMHNIWDWQAYNKSGQRVEAYRAMVFGANNEEVDLPGGAPGSDFAGILTMPANNDQPATLRRIGTVMVRLSNVAAAGKYGVISGTDGRITQAGEHATPMLQHAVCLFEESGVAGDLVAATVIFPAQQIYI